MAIRFYMDVHVPAAITEGLRRRGVDVLTSQEDGTREFDDATLLERGAELGRVLFSQDQDLLKIAAAWQTAGRPFAGLIFAHQQATSVGQCVVDLELLAEYCSEDELSGQVIFVPLR